MYFSTFPLWKRKKLRPLRARSDSHSERKAQIQERERV
jgi:hypothetical protein